MSARGSTTLDLSNPLALPVRLTTCEVLALARWARATLTRRKKAGKFPKPVERGVYLRDEVLEALGLLSPVGNHEDDKFKEATDAFHRDRATGKRRTPTAV